MKRKPLQILVIPYRKNGGSFEYAIFKRSDANYWQFIAGGAEGGESALEAAKRESFEEAGIPKESRFLSLDSTCSVPAIVFKDWQNWPVGTYVVHEVSFGVEYSANHFQLSEEHTDSKWCTYDEAVNFLKWDSNKTALWELSQRIRKC